MSRFVRTLSDVQSDAAANAPRRITDALPAPLYSKPQAAEKPQPVRAAVPPNHFELAALKKMLGDDLAEIEGAADAEGKSLAAYVRETMLAEVRKLK